MRKYTVVALFVAAAIVAWVLFYPDIVQEDNQAHSPLAGQASEQQSTQDKLTRPIAEESVDWPSHGLDEEEQRFSPLTQINRKTVAKLGLAWYRDMNTQRALEATPIVVDGVMYLTGTWSRVFAINALNGEEIWRYDPQVPGAWARRLCCDVVNRGNSVDTCSGLFKAALRPFANVPTAAARQRSAA